MASEQTLDIITYNRNALNNLRRAIVLGQGQFSLILARANYQQLREVIIAELNDQLHVDITYLPADTTSLRAAILVGQSTFESAENAQALMVTGLEEISEIERLLKSANLGRDELPKTFAYPVVLWVNDSVLSQLNRYAPDLKSFAATPVRFEYPLRSLNAALTAQANHTFTQVLNANQGIGFGSLLPKSNDIAEQIASQELSFALAELETQRIDERLLANLLFLQGRNLHQQEDLERARGYYEKSLLYWQQQADENEYEREERERHDTKLTHLERQTVLCFHLGLLWEHQAVLIELEKNSAAHSQDASDISLANRDAALQKARGYFEQTLASFRARGRHDRTARFLLPLAEVLQKLEDWPALQQLAQEGIRLHHNDLFLLARDYGYLAEVALAQYKDKYKDKPKEKHLSEARGFAQQALDLAKQTAHSLQGRSTNIMQATALRYYAGRYLYLLAIAQQLQGQSETAIQNLEKARIYAHPSYNLSLHLNILKRLRDLYFNRKQYAQAFEVKLAQRRTESLFGLRAFIGAGQIQPPKETSPFLSLPESTRLAQPQTEAAQQGLAAEIRASGRAQDIEAIASRLSQPRYPLVIVHGQSGVGKSSTLQAGLVPKLKTTTSEGRSILPVWIDSYSHWVEQADQNLTQRVQEKFTLVEFSIDLPLHGDTDSIDDTAKSPSRQQSANSTASSADLLIRLRALTEQTHQQVVLIFDQFEDFFHKNPTLAQRQTLYAFLRDCLEAPYIKVVLSLREDFLHYLLEWDRSADLSIINNDVLGKDIRYYLGNFRPEAAKTLLRQLTNAAGFILEDDLIIALVEDLAATTGEVRPIELQVVGAQLQRENITTLSQYQRLGKFSFDETALTPKQQLLENFINHVIQDCGAENAEAASAILYILSDGLNESSDRPLKTYSDIEEALSAADLTPSPQQIQLILDILIGSGLVFERLEVSGIRYQLVHEYLSDLIQKQQQPGLIAALKAERSRRLLTEAQLEKALSAQSENLAQTIIAKQAATTAEIKALVSVARSLLLSGQSLEALAQATRAAKQITGSAIGNNPLLKMQTALCLDAAIRSIREKNELVGHRNWVVAVDCNQTDAGEIIASASDDSTVKLWTTRGEVIRSLNHPLGVADVQFSPDGTLLASACLDHTIRIYRANGDFIRAIETSLASVTSLAFSPTQPLLAATYSDTFVRLWNLDGTLVRTLEGHEDWARAVAFSPDGQTIATGAEDRTVRLWKVSGELICVLKGHQGWVRSVAFSPDGKTIISAGDANTLKMWSREGRKLKTLYGHDDWVRSVAFSPDGKRIASGSDDQTIRIWSVNGTVEQVFNQRSSVHSVIWRADSQSVVSGGDDDQVHLWQLEGPPEPVCQAHSSIVWSARWHPNAEKILSSSGDNTLKIWDGKGNLLKSIDGHEKGTHSAEWSPDGLFFASASADYSVRIWSAEGEFVRSLIGHGDAVWQVCYSPNGRTLASVSSDRTLRLWTTKGNLIKTYRDHTDTIWHVDFSPDGQHLITASEDNTLRLWHIEKGLLQTIPAHEGGVWCAIFSPKGDFIASGGEDGDVRLWAVSSQNEQLTVELEPSVFKGHRDWIRSLSFSPNGKFIASASDDDTVRLWFITAATLTHKAEESGESQLLPPLTGHRDVIWDVDFDATGERIVSSGADGTMRIWDLRLETLTDKGSRWLEDWLAARPEVAKQLR